ncbi:fibronectin type III domain protein [Saccharothrix variisporea]|uniref:Fibronectin type III domain protein n=1 Tax=Saccharothrix variisporea TaxID=543527 RepID=A0A495XF61_9PSEU|nr:fibronectin type III domain protein [Saccharothrix variisporea]
MKISSVTRTRAMIAVLVAACVGVVGVAAAGQTPVAPGLQFFPVGHWVYNAAFQTAFHVDGSTNQVDARVAVPGVEPGAQVVQGERSGYVVERSRITVFDKSTLSVENAQNPPAAEQPVVLEVAGGPYLVYRNAGQVVRLGDPAATVPAGGPLSEPAVTGDGSVWLHRVDSGALCELPREAEVLTCPAQVEPGHTGALTVVDDRPVLVDTTADALRPFDQDGFGPSVPLGVDLPSTAQVASTTAGGRLAVVDPDRARMHLIDTAGLDKRPVADPVEVTLPGTGRYSGPVATARVVTLVDQTRNEVLTYDSDGARRSVTKVPGKAGSPRLARGEDDRVYVENQDGSQVLVVDGEKGSVVTMDVGKAADDRTDERPTGATTTTAAPETTTPTTTTPPADDRRITTRLTPPVARATAPGAPGDVAAEAGDASATVRWDPAPPNGAPVTAYHVSWDGGSTSVGGGTHSARLDGLANGVAHVFTVVAENEAGRGPGASSAAVVPLGVATAPDVTATTTFGGSTVTWTEPDLRGGTLVHYLVQMPGQPDRQVTGTTTDYTSFTGALGSLVTVRAVTRYGPPGSPTSLGHPGTAVVPTLLGLPAVKFVGVRWAGTGRAIATVDVNTSGVPTTCELSNFNLDNRPPVKVACAGVQEIAIDVPGTNQTSSLDLTLNASNANGSAQPATWRGVPASGGGAGGARRPRTSGGMAAW